MIVLPSLVYFVYFGILNCRWTALFLVIYGLSRFPGRGSDLRSQMSHPLAISICYLDWNTRLMISTLTNKNNSNSPRFGADLLQVQPRHPPHVLSNSFN